MSRIILVGLVMLGAAVAGCQKPLFPPDAHRTQYERYALLRGKARPATEQDAYGADQPALRERLRPLDQSY